MRRPGKKVEEELDKLAKEKRGSGPSQGNKYAAISKIYSSTLKRKKRQRAS